MAPGTTTRLASAGFVASVATLAFAAPAAYADPGGAFDYYQQSSPASPADARAAEEATNQGTSSASGGLTAAGARLMQEANNAVGQHPAPESTTTISWDVLPIATGAAGGILLVVITFGVATAVRRHHDHGQMAHPA